MRIIWCRTGVGNIANAVLTGYLGAPETAALVAEVVAEVKALNPTALYILDPVIGDQGAELVNYRVSGRYMIVDRLFARELGTSWRAAYLRLRLAHAARLLRQSPLSLRQIAYATGFSSPSHFSRAFGTAHGIPPGAWRRGGHTRSGQHGEP